MIFLNNYFQKLFVGFFSFQVKNPSVVDMSQFTAILTVDTDLWSSWAARHQSSGCLFSCPPPCEPVPSSLVPPPTSSCCCGSLPQLIVIPLSCFESCRWSSNIYVDSVWWLCNRIRKTSCWYLGSYLSVFVLLSNVRNMSMYSLL